VVEGDRPSCFILHALPVLCSLCSWCANIVLTVQLEHFGSQELEAPQLEPLEKSPIRHLY